MNKEGRLCKKSQYAGNRTAAIETEAKCAIHFDAPGFNEEELYVDLEPTFGQSLFLKCEGFNFAGSIKLKAAIEMVEAAELPDGGHYFVRTKIDPGGRGPNQRHQALRIFLTGTRYAR